MNNNIPSRYGILEKFCGSFNYDKDTFQADCVPPNWVYMTRVALNERGLDMEFDELEKFLYEEGMAPAYVYGIPASYRKKYNIK